MKRREFLGALGVLAAWPLAAGAQQTTRARTIGFLLPGGSRTTVVRGQLEAFRQALKEFSTCADEYAGPHVHYRAALALGSCWLCFLRKALISFYGVSLAH
jgi:hypothetical protein